MSDEFEDAKVEKVYSVDEVVKNITKEFKSSMSEKGTVDISDYSLTVS